MDITIIRVSYRLSDISNADYRALDKWMFENYNTAGISIRNVSQKSCISEIIFANKIDATAFALKFPNVIRNISNH